MSIRTVQTERLLQDVVRSLYSEGVQPTLANVLGQVAQYFSHFPAGLPLPLDQAFSDSPVSDPNEYNRILNYLAINIDVLYEACLGQVDEVLLLTASLQDDLDRLSAHRRRIETRIDDYLLSLYNTDGYYYSASDTFSDTSLSDLGLTTAQIDTRVGAIILPTITSRTKRIDPELIGGVDIALTARGQPHPFREVAPFSGALEDSLSNIVWAIEAESAVPTEMIATVTVRFVPTQPVHLSRVDFSPYGTVPVQMFVETEEAVGSSTQFVDFGGRIQTSGLKMTFGTGIRIANSVRFTLRKTQPDYTDTATGSVRYRYIFGAKDITFLHQLYDNDAVFVSDTLGLPADLTNDMVIDAVSLVVEEDVPSDTTLDYFVATATGSEVNLDEFIWKPILPISSGDVGEKIIRFNGAASRHRRIVAGGGGNNLTLMPMVTAGAPVDRNPSPSIVPGVDIYRLARFNDPVLLNSLQLLEGVNTIRMYSRPLDPLAINDLNYWATKVNDAATRIDYGRIDVGNEFFYGGDIGESSRSVFVETYVNSIQDRTTFLSDFQKSDPNSRLWDVKVFLNGRQVGYLPAGVERLQIPWTFQRGLNHVALLVNIPAPSAGYQEPYIGTLNLMADTVLYEYGEVFLASWSYVDFFTMQYNETGQPTTFTIHNEEIISRRKPTTNFLLKYAVPTGNSPVGIRLRADLSRSSNNPYVSPKLNSYRLRFLYGPEGD